MSVAYKIKSSKQKAKSQSKKGILVKRTSANQTCNMEMVKFMSYYYKNGVAYEWKPEDVYKVKEAMRLANEHLNKALVDKGVENNKMINDAIKKIRKVLLSRELEIYPLDEKWLGQARKGYKQISINIKRIHKCYACQQSDLLFSIAKTLIHEAFHIIGGCVEGKSEDSICGDSVDKDCAFDRIVSKSSIEEMEADDFAQFVMMC